MDHTSSDSGSIPVRSSMNQEEEVNSLSAPGSMPVSERGSTDDLNTTSQELKINIPNTPDTVSEPNLNTVSQEHQINIPSTPGSKSASESGITDIQEDHIKNGSASIQSPPRLGVNLASFNLAKASRGEYMNICLPLYEAAITGDWEAAEVILDQRPELVRCAITHGGDTILHIAVAAEDTKLAEIFVEKLIKRMDMKDLEIENNSTDSAFLIAAANGTVKMIEIILNKHKDLLSVSSFKALELMDVSIELGNRDMALHFYNVLKNMPSYPYWTLKDRTQFFRSCIAGDMYDIALIVLSDNPEIAASSNTCKIVLDILARRPDVFNITEPSMVWRITDPIFAYFHKKKETPEMSIHAFNLLKAIFKLYPMSSDELYTPDKEPLGETDITLSKLLYTAAETGSTRFVIELLRMYPNILWKKNSDGLSIFHIAVMHRHKDIYNLVYEIGSKKVILTRSTDDKKNCILHLVGSTSKKNQVQTVSGASLLMQRELLWFKEVEKITPRHLRYSKNNDGQTPYDLFSESNQEIVSKGLKWTRDCMVVATLIITVAFAAAFTVPGGYNQEIGIPIFTHETSFLVFLIADSVSLFSSSTSLLVFLSILTSPYGPRDFLYSLPRKLMIGLVTLFISVAAMMVTFAASFFVMYHNTFEWLPILISIFAAMPVLVFASLQYPLLMDMFRSMYDSRYLFKPKKHMLYNTNQQM